MADIQVNLLLKENRDLQSHDIAKLVRPEVQKIAKKSLPVHKGLILRGSLGI